MSLEKLVYIIDSQLPLTPLPKAPSKTDDALYRILSIHKNIITEHYHNKKWDRHKKQSNLYELVFTTGHVLPSLSSRNPTSRSFFKHWEILHDFEDELGFKSRSEPMRCAFLAEGPGGFIEAFAAYRDRDSRVIPDSIFGVTLISSDRTVPSWKLPRKMLDDKNIKLLYGVDGTGSLYNTANIERYIQEIGEARCEYITADGGFDFSNNFNDQEEISIKLIVAEVYTALKLQKEHGSFLLKIYDMQLTITKQLLYILSKRYKTLNFIKPLTSRPANSEKYVLCLDYDEKPCEKDMAFLWKKIESGGKRSYSMFAKEPEPTPPQAFCNHISNYNMYYVTRQITHINTTLNYIATNHVHATTIKSQIEHAIKWCHKYNIPISIDALRYYKTHFVFDKKEM
jgi:23S rRNA U2552 (ribose-2'-O)-methylase RlmE/FtsJ